MDFYRNNEIANSKKDYPEDEVCLPLLCEGCGKELKDEDPEGVYCLECAHDRAENQIEDR